MLLWRPGSLVTLLLTYMLPLKYSAPCAAAFLLAMLHTTVRHCTNECRDGRQVAAARFYGGGRGGHARRRRSWLLLLLSLLLHWAAYCNFPSWRSLLTAGAVSDPLCPQA